MFGKNSKNTFSFTNLSETETQKRYLRKTTGLRPQKSDFHISQSRQQNVHLSALDRLATQILLFLIFLHRLKVLLFSSDIPQLSDNRFINKSVEICSENASN